MSRPWCGIATGSLLHQPVERRVVVDVVAERQFRPGRDPARPRDPASAPRQCRCSRRCRRTDPHEVAASRGDNSRRRRRPPMTMRRSLPVRRSVAAVTKMAVRSVGYRHSTRRRRHGRERNRTQQAAAKPLHARWSRDGSVRQDQGCVRREMRYQRRHGARGARRRPSRRSVRPPPRRVWSRSCRAGRQHSAEPPAPVSAEGRAVSWSNRREGILP